MTTQPEMDILLMYLYFDGVTYSIIVKRDVPISDAVVKAIARRIENNGDSDRVKNNFLYEVDEINHTAKVRASDLLSYFHETVSSSKDEHYEKSAMQPLQVMQVLMSKEQFLGFLLGNVIKYTMRADYKGQKESDKRKAKTYYYWYTLALDGAIIDPVKDRVGEDFKIDGVFNYGK